MLAKLVKLARLARLERAGWAGKVGDGWRLYAMTIYVVARNGMSNTRESTLDFTVLERQVLHLSEVTAKHAAMVAAVAEVARKIRGGRTRFTADEKKNIEQELEAVTRTCGRCVRGGCCRRRSSTHSSW
jgi:hypothetical protein